MPQASDRFNDAELEFLRDFHEAKEVGMILAKFIRDYTIVDKMKQYDRFQALFSEFNWDEIYDYFEDSAVYDRTLKAKLRKQLGEISKW